MSTSPSIAANTSTWDVDQLKTLYDDIPKSLTVVGRISPIGEQRLFPIQIQTTDHLNTEDTTPEQREALKAWQTVQTYLLQNTPTKKFYLVDGQVIQAPFTNDQDLATSMRVVSKRLFLSDF